MLLSDSSPVLRIVGATTCALALLLLAAWLRLPHDGQRGDRSHAGALLRSTTALFAPELPLDAMDGPSSPVPLGLRN